MGNQSPLIGIKSYSQYKQRIQKNSISDRPPFTKPQLAYLKRILQQANQKNILEVSIKQLQDIMILKQFIFFSRLQAVFDKIKGPSKKPSFQKFVEVMKVFHINTSDQQKYKFLFQVMDCDEDGKLNVDDINDCFWLIYKSTVVVDQNTLKQMAEEIISQNNDEDIDFNSFKKLISRQEMLAIMTMKFEFRD